MPVTTPGEVMFAALAWMDRALGVLLALALLGVLVITLYRAALRTPRPDDTGMDDRDG